MSYLRAAAVSQCTNPRFRKYADIEIDVFPPAEMAQIKADFELQLYRREVNFSFSSLAEVIKTVLPSNEDTLLAACPHRRITDGEPIPTPPEPTPTPQPSGHGGYQRIAVVNLSSASSAEVRKWTDAWAWQLEKQYSREYGNAEIFIGEQGEGDIRHEILNQADGNFGGYHTTDAQGNPIARTFLDSGNPSGVGSHENLEVLFNPWILGWWMLNCQYKYWAELCDPVQRIFYPAPNGELVSDFVLKAWAGTSPEFDPKQLHAAAKYANIPVLQNRFQIASGGYMGRLDSSSCTIEYVNGAVLGAVPEIGCAIRQQAMIDHLQKIDPRIKVAA